MSKGHGSSIERKGVNDVMQGFDLAAENGYMYYMLFQGSTPKMTYEDDDMAGNGRAMLEDILNACLQNGTKAVYSLRFYKSLPKSGTLDTSTPYGHSFNFIINDGSTYPMMNGAIAGTGYAPGPSQVSKEVLELLQRMDARLAKLEAEEVGVEEDDLSKAERILEIPAVQNIVQGISGFLSNWMMRSAAGRPGGGLSGVPAEPADPADQAAKLKDGVLRLRAVDPNLGDHMQMLAHLAETNRIAYDGAIDQLKTFVNAS